MIKKILANFLVLLFTVATKSYGNEKNNELKIRKSGNTIEILNFKDGDKIHMFDFNSGVHVLSKTRNTIDFTQIPIGEYIIIDSNDRVVVLEKTYDTLQSLLFSRDILFVAQKYYMNFDAKNRATNMLGVVIGHSKETIVIENFDNGDKLKLFQAKDSTHILTKTYNTIDFSCLSDGKYFLEKNNSGVKVGIEKREGIIILPNTGIATTSL